MDRAAFEALIERCRGPLDSYLRRFVRNPADRLDILQGVLLQLWRRHQRHSLDRETEGAFLRTCAYRAFINWWRAGRRWRSLQQFPVSGPTGEGEASSFEPEDHRSKDPLDQLLDAERWSTLPENERAVLLLREAGYNFREIGEWLGITLAASYRLFLSARKRLRGRLDESEGD